MLHARPFVPILSLAAALAVAPMLAGVALAADPTVVVRPGDTLTGLSKRHGISIADLVELNDLSDPNRIYAGQRLRLLRSEPAAPAAPPPAPTPAPASKPAATERSHTVRAGEHLTGIARHYGVTIAAIAAANRIANPSHIYAGQRLAIPGSPAPASPPSSPAPAPAPKPAATERSHTVRAGEHLTGIARHYGVTIAAIAAANRIANPSHIYAGQRLAIPGAPSSPSSPSPRAAAPRLPVPPSMRALMERRGSVRQVIVEEARRFEVPQALALALAWQESGWQQNVVSHAGAIGVMQLLPATAEWVGEAMLGTRVDPRDTRHNVRAGVRLLAHYLDRYGGNVDLALAAYYQGQAAADRHGVYPVSRSYIASIKALTRLLGG